MMAPASQRHDTYIRRREEAMIEAELDRVRGDGQSRAVLIYGTGGVGKTQLVRAMADAHRAQHNGVTWVSPIDVDDSVYWLLSNLGLAVAKEIDPDRRYFQPYFDYASRLPRYISERVGHETVASHIVRAKQKFLECYQDFIAGTGRTVVVTLDTVEAIRSMHLLFTLTQWMKALPGTLFILSGRPLSNREHDDPIKSQLDDPHHPLKTTEIALRGFDRPETLSYLDSGPLGPSLSIEEREQLFQLTEGHPLWLALAVDFLQHTDPPPEMVAPTLTGERLREAFRRRLVAPYRSTDFWPEAIKRLAVVRHSVNQEVWQLLMDDRELPELAENWDQAWQQLLHQPWVRPRANQRYVTLHDALAEELAQRLIPLHDRDEEWRQWLWDKAAGAYARLTEGVGERLRHDLEQVIAQLVETPEDPALIQRITELDTEKRELDQLTTAHLHYQLLVDFQAGTDRFIELNRQATERHDLLFQELICHELERFLPHGTAAEPLEDVLGIVVQRFHSWLTIQAPVRYLEVGLSIARFLTHNEQPRSALELLRVLPESGAYPELRYRLANERGNACMRIPEEIDNAKAHFDRALTETRGFDSPEQQRREAEARKEFGFYFRNLGRWHDADQSYHSARDVISTILRPGSPLEDREEMASIQTNWAYLKALQGNYEEARNLVESAITVRRRIGKPHPVGVSLSVSGEVFRYDHKFVLAWQEYEAAEVIFQELRSVPWLGLIYQEQAICLYQATQERVAIVDNQTECSVRLIKQALDICRELAVRSYPSALNRAGRIFGAGDTDTGLRYLDESIDEARKIADGWFLSANLIEYLELSYRAWMATKKRDYRDRIHDRVSDVERAIRDYGFPDLRARWDLLQGHLALCDALEENESESLDVAVQHYSEGFAGLADERVGSHGSAAIAREFRRFHDLYARLPIDTRASWYDRLRKDWSEVGSTSLLARLEELY